MLDHDFDHPFKDHTTRQINEGWIDPVRAAVSSQTENLCNRLIAHAVTKKIKI